MKEKDYHIEENLEVVRVDMSFHEMLTNLFDTSFLTPDELETICDCAEMYAAAKVKNSKTNVNK